MRSPKITLLLVLFFVMSVLTVLSSSVPAKSANLGIGVKPLPKTLPNDRAKLTENSNLWFVLKQGSALERAVLLRGSSINQIVNLGIISAQDNNGKISPSTNLSPINDWVRFSENNFLLKANENKVIQIQISVPKNIPSQAFNAYLSVTVGGESNQRKAEANPQRKVEARLYNQIQTLLRMFVGVGSYNDFFTDLQIEDVKDYSISGAKYLDVVIKNTGKTPITPSGDVSFSSLDFAGLRFGPITYLTLTMEPGKTSKFKMRLPDEIEPGNWQILVKAQQGEILRTKIFEKNLKFREGIFWFGVLSRVVAAFFAILIFYYLRRNYSLSKRTEIEVEPAPISKSAKKILKRVASIRHRKVESPELDHFDVEKFLNELRLERTKKAATKKAAR